MLNLGHQKFGGLFLCMVKRRRAMGNQTFCGRIDESRFLPP
jgi:hypothetical protein